MASILCTSTQHSGKGGNRLISKLNYWAMWACFILLTTVVLGYTYLSQIDGVYLNKPITFHYWFDKGEVTHLTTKMEYKPGEVVYAKIIAHKNQVWPAIIQWTLVDGCFHPYPPKSGVLEAGRTEKTVKVERLELDVKPGEDYFQGSATFDLNFIRRKIHIPLKTNTFTILPADSKK